MNQIQQPLALLKRVVGEMKTNTLSFDFLISKKIVALVSVAICLLSGCDDGRLYPLGYDSSRINNEEDGSVETDIEEDADADPYAENDTESGTESDTESDTESAIENGNFSCPLNSAYPCACDLENGESCEDGSKCIVPKHGDIGICTWHCSYENLSAMLCLQTGKFGNPLAWDGLCELTPSVSSPLYEQYCFPTCSYLIGGDDDCPKGLVCDTLFYAKIPVPDEVMEPIQPFMEMLPEEITDYFTNNDEVIVDFSVCVPPRWRFDFPLSPMDRPGDSEWSPYED